MLAFLAFVSHKCPIEITYISKKGTISGLSGTIWGSAPPKILGTKLQFSVLLRYVEVKYVLKDFIIGQSSQNLKKTSKVRNSQYSSLFLCGIEVRL